MLRALSRQVNRLTQISNRSIGGLFNGFFSSQHVHPNSPGELCPPNGTPYPPLPEIVKEPHFKIVDSTLREGEQFQNAFFSTKDKLMIAQLLNGMGVEYIEMTNPLASEHSRNDLEKIANLGLRSKVVTHIRCHMDDAKCAIDCGVDGVQMYMATSQALRQHSHGKGIDYIIDHASRVIEYCQQHNVEIRFSCEDTFRTDLDELLRVYAAVSGLGISRVGMADTVGVASPLQVLEVARRVRSAVHCDIEFHTHNDTGCAISNALIALQGGATHIDTCVLGIGERNGITPLGGFLARMYTYNESYQELVKLRYDLSLLQRLEEYVAKCAGVEIPFNNYVTGSAAFCHKAGVHSKAVMQNPKSYEVIDPADFGVSRDIKVAHRLTGWNAVANRTQQLGLEIADQQIKEVTRFIKNLADTKKVTTSDLDFALRKCAEGNLVDLEAIFNDETQSQSQISV